MTTGKALDIGMEASGSGIRRSRLLGRQKKAAEKSTPKQKNRAGRPTAAEIERRKLFVLQVATDLFISRGFAATSMVDISKEAGVATRTLYQHFGDKEAIFREVILARDTGVVAPQPQLEPGDTITSLLTRTALYTIEVTLRPQSIDRMRLVVAESNRFPDFLQKIVAASSARFQRNITKIFEAAGAAGLIPDRDHARSAMWFSDFILGNTASLPFTNWKTSPPNREDLDERIALFIRGRFGDEVAKPSSKKRAAKG
jgi:TetR/AcrR family transcriptional repressor of mexJK operon